ncbi:MAG: OmpH family outer membrane protein [Acidobacteriota bacterium]
MQTMIVMGAVGAMLVAAPGFGQTPAPRPPAAAPAATPAQPPTTTPPAAAQPAAPAQPPRPFPEGSKFAFVDIQAVASLSSEGKSASAKLDALKKKKNDELVGKSTALKTMQDKLTSGGSVMSDSARGQLEKDIEKAQRDLQFAQQDAQTELTDMTNQLQGEFQDKLNPIMEAVRAEKGLLMIFSVRDSGILAADAGLDLSNEVVKRFDAAAKAAPAAAPKK